MCARRKGEPGSGGAAGGLSSDPCLGFDSHTSKTSVTPTSPDVPGIQVSAEVLVKVSLLPALGCEGVQAHSHFLWQTCQMRNLKQKHGKSLVSYILLTVLILVIS